MNTAPYSGATRGGRFWYALGSAKTVRIIFICMIVYFLIIFGLVLGYSNVQNCLADYSDQSAAASKARSDAAAIDRRLNARYDDLSTSERARLRRDQDALLILVRLLADGRELNSQAVQNAIANVESVYQASADIAKVNDSERRRLDQERGSAESLRALNPPPEPPSESC